MANHSLSQLSKSELRKYYKTLLLGIKNQASRSEILAESIITSSEFSRSKILLTYSPLLNEVDLSLVINAAELARKTVLLPASISLPPQLKDNLTGNLIPELQGIKVDLALIPGLAFDSSGGRLGRGGGWYDRLLTELDVNIIWGSAFAEQISATPLSLDPWDIKMTKVLVA